MLEIIKTNDGYMVQHTDGDLEGDYVCDANGDNLWNTYAEAEAVFWGVPKLKKYKVWAKSTSHYYAFIEASDSDQAWDKALAMDGSDFIPLDQGIVQNGDWDIVSTEELPND
jgi:hypothetical protein